MGLLRLEIRELSFGKSIGVEFFNGRGLGKRFFGQIRRLYPVDEALAADIQPLCRFRAVPHSSSQGFMNQLRGERYLGDSNVEGERKNLEL